LLLLLLLVEEEEEEEEAAAAAAATATARLAFNASSLELWRRAARTAASFTMTFPKRCTTPGAFH